MAKCERRFSEGCTTMAYTGYGDAHQCYRDEGHAGGCVCTCGARYEADPEALIPICLAVCEARGWSLHWTARGAYLHLEASELIEAWRGKGKSTVAQEAGDVLLVLFSILGVAKVSWAEALGCARAKMEDLQTRPRYPGEEYSETEATLAIRGDKSE